MLLIINIKDTDDIKLYRNGILYNIKHKFTREFNKVDDSIIIFYYFNYNISSHKYKKIRNIQGYGKCGKYIEIYKYIKKSFYYKSYYYDNKKDYSFFIKNIKHDFAKGKNNYFYYNNYKIFIITYYVKWPREYILNFNYIFLNIKIIFII